MARKNRWAQLRREKNYSHEQMLKFLGVSRDVFSGMIARKDPKLNEMFERFLLAVPMPPKKKSPPRASKQDGSLDLAPKTRRLLPEVGEVLRRNGSVAKVVRVVNDTDIEVDVQYVPDGPWFRKEWTVKPHNRTTDEGAWEATGRVKTTC